MNSGLESVLVLEDAPAGIKGLGLGRRVLGCCCYAQVETQGLPLR